MPTPHRQLVIFDCDGVLVDSETLGNRVIADTVRELGVPMTFEESIRRFRGLKMSEVVLAIEHLLGYTLPESFVPGLRARMAVLFNRELRAVEGIEPVLDALPMPYCVASNAPMEKIRLTLGVTGLLPRFEGRIFSAYEVNVWKPDPGLYLHAARAMDTAPAGCVVVEDSVPGVRAGVAAGMRVLGFAPAGEGSDLESQGAELFSSMSGLIRLVSRL